MDPSLLKSGRSWPAPADAPTAHHPRRPAPRHREQIKPFVFLDYFDMQPVKRPGFRDPPALGHRDDHGSAAGQPALRGHHRKKRHPAGRRRRVDARRRRRSGTNGEPLPGDRVQGLQLWIALPAAEENGPAESQYIDPRSVPQEGPVRVILGSYATRRAPSARRQASTTCTCVSRTASAGSTSLPPATTWPWTYSVTRKELAVFEEGETALSFEGPAEFRARLAVKHPHELALGYYSVHTNAKALAAGEAEIRRIGERLNLPMGVLA